MLQAFEDEQPLTKPYKYMYQSAQTIGDVLNERILSMADEMQDGMLNKGKEGEEEEYASIGEINSVSIRKNNPNNFKFGKCFD